MKTYKDGLEECLELVDSFKVDFRHNITLFQVNVQSAIREKIASVPAEPLVMPNERELTGHYNGEESQEWLNASLGKQQASDAVADELKTKYKYIHFVEGLKDEWTVWTNKNDEYLGVITFHKKWKEWEFAPEQYTGYTIECLNDLINFIKHLPATASA